jgi:hypothetical protein
MALEAPFSTRGVLERRAGRPKRGRLPRIEAADRGLLADLSYPTSACSVMSDPLPTDRPRIDHPSAIDPERLLAECDVRRTRRSGPGGQNRNKVETAIVLTHRPTGLVAEANERRSQAENGRVALFRLRLSLAVEVRRAGEGGEAPSPLWRSRCRGGRISVSPEHEDFPALLAEALDALAARGMDVGASAEALGCSASQLTKLLKLEPRALRKVNDRRGGLGLRPLR